MKKLLFIIGCILNNGFTMELPSYIPRCSLSSPNLNECITEKANLAIPFLAQGDQQLNIPSMSPLYIPDVKLHGRNFKLSATDVSVYGLRSTILTRSVFDLENKVISKHATLDVLTIIGHYSIQRGKILNQRFSGSGKFIMTSIGNNMDFNSDFYLNEREDGNYIQLVNSTVKFRTNRVYYMLENLHTTGRGDANVLLNKNWRIVNDEILPSLQKLIKQLFLIPLENLNNNVPIENIFNP